MLTDGWVSASPTRRTPSLARVCPSSLTDSACFQAPKAPALQGEQLQTSRKRYCVVTQTIHKLVAGASGNQVLRLNDANTGACMGHQGPRKRSDRSTAAVKSLLTVRVLLQQKPESECCA